LISGTRIFEGQVGYLSRTTAPTRHLRLRTVFFLMPHPPTRSCPYSVAWSCLQPLVENAYVCTLLSDWGH